MAQAAVTLEEGAAARAGEKAQVLRVAAPRDRQSRRSGELANAALVHLAEREAEPRQRRRRKGRQDIALVLRTVGRGREQRGLRAAPHARVVAGRKLLGAEAIGER